MRTKVALLTALMLTPLYGKSQSVDKITVETDFIANNFFIVYESWMNLDIDSQKGEDLKSKTYATYYYNKCVREYPEWKDETTIAAKEMYVDLNVSNKSSSTWKASAISVIVSDHQEIANKNIQHGEWRYGQRSEEDDIEITIQDTQIPNYYIPNNITFLAGNEGDNFLNLTIKVNEELKSRKLLLAYTINITLTEVGTGKKVEISPNKIYHLYTNK